MDGLDVTIVNIALPHAQNDLGFTLGERQWIVTAYSLAFGSLLLLFGRISDIIGRRTMLLLGLVGFAVASALGAQRPPSASSSPPAPCKALQARQSPPPPCPCSRPPSPTRKTARKHSRSSAASPAPAPPSA
ncbi:MFS transporter [Propionibacterium freudenreichii]|uniref:MFS transporter n=1 Tax=Propionibacterium freudenreichii TaxID=1744 RepID=UPI003BF5DDCD